MSRSDVLGLGLCGLGAAVTFLVAPHWGWLFLLLSVAAFVAYVLMGRNEEAQQPLVPTEARLTTNNNHPEGRIERLNAASPIDPTEQQRREFVQSTLSQCSPPCLELLREIVLSGRIKRRPLTATPVPRHITELFSICENSKLLITEGPRRAHG